jgi:hypothetical protein
MLSQAPTQPESDQGHDQSSVATPSTAESAELSAINICHRETMTRVILARAGG